MRKLPILIVLASFAVLIALNQNFQIVSNHYFECTIQDPISCQDPNAPAGCGVYAVQCRVRPGYDLLNLARSTTLVTLDGQPCNFTVTNNSQVYIGMNTTPVGLYFYNSDFQGNVNFYRTGPSNKTFYYKLFVYKDQNRWQQCTSANYDTINLDFPPMGGQTSPPPGGGPPPPQPETCEGGKWKKAKCERNCNTSCERRPACGQKWYCK